MKHTGDIVEVDILNQLFVIRPDIYSTMPHEFVVEFKNNWFEAGDKLIWETNDDFFNY